MKTRPFRGILRALSMPHLAFFIKEHAMMSHNSAGAAPAAGRNLDPSLPLKINMVKCM